MGSDPLTINLFEPPRTRELISVPLENDQPANLPLDFTSTSPINSGNEQLWQGILTRHHLDEKLRTQQTMTQDLNGLSVNTPVTVEIKPQDTQADVLRRAYQTYAAAAGLSEESQQVFVQTMMESGGDRIQHRNSDRLFTDQEFAALKRGKGSIEMYPSAAQIAELHTLKKEESEVITIDTVAYAQTGEITFKNTDLAAQNFAVVRRYLQQNLLGADFYFVEHGDDVTSRALSLGVRPELEEIGKNDAGETVYRVKITPEDAERFGQIKLEYEQRKAIFEGKMAAARNEVDQMFADQGRVLWNSAVNVVEGTVNLAIDAALTRGGQNPLPLTNPFRPQVDFSGAKVDYQSEMMRRDINGVVDGDGVRKGDAIEVGVTVVAPLVVGRVVTPKVGPQTLRTLGALPEEQAPVVSNVVQDANRLNTSGVSPVVNNTTGTVKYNSKPMLQQYVGEETGAVWGTKVKYLNDAERAGLELSVQNGRIVNSTGALFDTSSSSSVFGAGQGRAIFVMDESGRIYASGAQSVGKFHHSSLLGGKPVSAAGEIVVKNGKVVEISNRSGHYQPTQQMNQQILNELRSRGVDVSNVKISGF